MTEFQGLGFNNETNGSFFSPNPETLQSFRTEFEKARRQKVTTILIAGMINMHYLSSDRLFAARYHVMVLNELIW
jgi:hypothetical protein